MATAAPHVKLLRQLASAKDDYLSGAFDISWDGAKATLFLVFGRPSHAVFETGDAQIEGEAAIDALLAVLPRVFFVSDWRRAMSPHETLSITIDELAGPFVRLAGSYADEPVTDESPEWWSAIDDSPDLPFGLADFPLLPGGRPLWVETSPEDVHLAERLSELPPSILILTGAKLRAAAIVSGGDLIDAVWIDADDHARGETAGMALLGATKGSLAGYALDDPRVAEALTMLWRLPLAVSGVELSWLDPASMLAAFRADGLDRVLVIDAPVRGIALFSRGGLVAVYSETQRSAVASPERLRSLLSQARGRLTVMERKPRPLGTEAAAKPASAHDFFEADVTVPAPEAAPLAASDAGIAADAEPITTADGEPASAAIVEAEPSAGAAALGFITTDASQDAAAPTLAADVPTGDGSDASHAVADAAADPFELPPPPPPEDLSADATGAPPPPPPAPEAREAAADKPAKKPKRSRWGFGRSRRSRAERHAVEEAAAVVPEPTTEPSSDAATFAGWSVRQPSANPEPVWQRSLDPAAPVAQDESDEQAASTTAVEPTLEPDGTDQIAAAGEPTDGAAQPEDGHGVDFITFDAPSRVTEPLEEPAPETPVAAAPEAWLSTSWLDDVVNDVTPAPAAADPEGATHEDAVPAGPDDLPETAADPAAASDPEIDVASEPESAAEPSPESEQVVASSDSDAAAEAPRLAPAVRTPGPWSWPLAEPDEETHPPAPDLEPAVVTASGREEMTSTSDNETEAGFFHRNEPVGSQYVDFDEVRNELIQIGIVWLGETNAAQVTELLSTTRSTIDDFVATIDTIRGLHLEGQDPASIQAMAREMHQQAAERLCGA